MKVDLKVLENQFDNSSWPRFDYLMIQFITDLLILLHFRIKHLIGHLTKDDGTEMDTETIISNLEYISEVLQAIVLKTE